MKLKCPVGCFSTNDVYHHVQFIGVCGQCRFDNGHRYSCWQSTRFVLLCGICLCLCRYVRVTLVLQFSVSF